MRRQTTSTVGTVDIRKILTEKIYREGALRKPKEIVLIRGLGSTGSRHNSAEGSCEHGDELSGSTERRSNFFLTGRLSTARQGLHKPTYRLNQRRQRFNVLHSTTTALLSSSHSAILKISIVSKLSILKYISIALRSSIVA